ncbi:6-bladed beta-propeller [Parabacteroides goldsteinii]|uniref:6-bladed beta-propeller n=1 Tax=uncultured Parabacteroides sp. TaxID=512312 RepID=UPI00101CF4E3|nr:6-bladed beta-propeller [Parabacteroides goldsteinii]
MRSVDSILFFVLLLMAGCGESKQSTDDCITVDVTANYPQKKLILQDFMDVEYIPLETNDEFLCQGNIQAVGKDVIVATNRIGGRDGNIFIFDRKGKALKKINHKGQGGEEYTSFVQIILDEDNAEMFVNDMYAKKILVYDLKGNFKRKISLKGDFLFGEIYNFDQNNFICHDVLNENNFTESYTGQSFMFISKQDGVITQELQIPFKEKKTIVVRTPRDKDGNFFVYMPPSVYPIIPYFDNYILTELSADTLYKYSANHTMKPFIVRTPSVQSMNPEKFLLLSLLTDRYYFMEVVEKVLPFSSTDIVYDKQENTLFRYKVYNSDYTYDKEAFLKSEPLNGEIPSCQYLEAWELIKDYKGGRLKGKLKDIASKLGEEDNPVIMLIKHKK